MQDNNFTFKSDTFILQVNTPILILHAEDDRVVPFKLGYKVSYIICYVLHVMFSYFSLFFPALQNSSQE